MGEPSNIAEIVNGWLALYRDKKKAVAARNLVAVGIVVLDRLLAVPRLTEQDAFTQRGELKGARSGLRSVLARHGIPETYLKEATGRQAAKYARTLLENLEWGDRIPNGKEERQKYLEAAIDVLVKEAAAWLHQDPLKISCDRQCSPITWVSAILKKAEGRSGGRLEQHLIGAKLQERYAERIKVPKHPGHAADVQTRRSGDFDLGRVSYHVTSNPTRGHLQKCKENAAANRVPVLIVPAGKVEKARVYAGDEGMDNRVTILSIEDFVAQNVIEISSEYDVGVFEIMKAIIDEYNRRVMEIEKDVSLVIQIQ
jgi:hypothetical protein